MDNVAEKLIMLDFDSTIADSLRHFSTVLEARIGFAPKFEDIHHSVNEDVARKLNVPIEIIEETVDVAFHSDKFVDDVKPLPGAIEHIRELETAGYIFRIVSLRNDDESAAPARAWLGKYGLNNIPFVCVPTGETKESYVSDCVLGVDDLPSNLEAMRDVIPHLVLMDPYQIGYKTDFHTASSWKEISDLIKRLV